MKIEPRFDVNRNGPRLSLAIIMFLFALVQACEQEGCEMLGPIPGGFPADKKLQNAVQMRISEEGMDFLEQELIGLVEASLPEGMVFDVPPVCEGGTQICCETPDPECKLDLGLNDLSLSPKSPDSLEFALRTVLITQSRSGAYLPVKTKVLGIEIKCDAMIDTTRAGRADVEIRGQIRLTVDPKTNKTRLNLQNITLSQLDDNDLDLSGGAGCTIANWLKTFFIDTVVDQFGSAIDDTVEKQMCTKCTGQLPLSDECGPEAGSCRDGFCMSGNQCMQAFGLEGRLDLGQALAAIFKGLEGALDVYAVAGNYAEVSGSSLSLGWEGGAESVSPKATSCVPPSSPPTLEPINRSPTFNGNPTTDIPYHLGVGIHRHFLNRMAFAFWQTGILCAELGGEDLGGLNTDLLTALVPSLGDLIRDWPRPVLLKLRPTQSPYFELQGNVFEVDDFLETTMIEPLLKIHLPAAELDFYALIDDRFVRLFTLAADVGLPLGLDTDESGRLIPVLGDLENAVTNIQIRESGLLEEKDTDTEVLFGAALSLLLPSLAAALPPIELPEYLGLKLSPIEGGITSVDEGDMLGLFLELQKASPTHGSRPITTRARAVGSHIAHGQTAEHWRSDPQKDTSWVELKIEARDEHGKPLPVSEYEWQYRIGSGFWSAFRRADDQPLRLVDPVFRWQGVHAIQVRTRKTGEPFSLDAVGDTVDFVVDTRAPWVKVSGGRVVAWDAVTPERELRFEYLRSAAAPAGEGVGWKAGNVSIPLGAEAVRVIDLVGHATTLRFQAAAGDGLAFPAHSSPSSCSVAGAIGAHPSSLPRGTGFLNLVFWLILVLFYRNKRSRFAPALLSGLFLLATAGCSGNGGGGGAIDTDDPGPDTEDGGPPSQTENSPGSAGRYSDLVVHENGIFLVGYEEKFGDLLFGRASADNSIDWTFADGLPDEPPSYPQDTYRRGIHSPGDDVGRYASLVLNAEGTALISHHDFTGRSLRFTAGTDPSNESFVSHEVDGFDNRVFDDGRDSPFKNRVGLYTSLTLDSSGLPAIAYMAAGVPREDGTLVSELRVARAARGVPAAPGDWKIETVDSTAISCAGMCQREHVCLESGPKEDAGVEDFGRCVAISENCDGYCPAGEACVEIADVPRCAPYAAPPRELGFPPGLGLWPSLVSLPQGNLAISYYDRAAGRLKLALLEDGVWAKFNLDETGNAGAYSSMTADGEGALHISYQDLQAGQLRYLSFDGETVGEREVADEGLHDNIRHLVGADSCILHDGEQIHIVYQDQTSLDLVLATRTAPDTWVQIRPSAGDFAKGFYNQIARDTQGNRWISHYIYDRGQTVPGRIELLELP